jgi:DNA repair protein SbcD/Mre11
MLRLLHTSDWHLGLELGSHDRLEEQRLFLKWLLDTAQSRQIDALLVCGDVYDTTNPSVAAQKLFNEFLVDFHRALPKASLVTIAGNHDSAARLELPRPFGAALGELHLRGVVTDSVQDHLVGLRDRDGNLAAWCLAIPFLRASDLDCRLQGSETPQVAFQRAVAVRYQAAREAIPPEERHLPIVSMGHLTLAGSQRAGSERILIGGVESVPVDALSKEAAYVALGHIHRAQTVGSQNVRYCGSPYPVDFDERRHRHLVLAVELDATGLVDVQEIPVPEFVPFLRFCEPAVLWDDLERTVREFDWSPWEKTPRALQPLVDLRYDDKDGVADLRVRCEALCRNRPFRLVSAPRSMSQEKSGGIASRPSLDLKEREAPEALLDRHWTDKHGTALPPPLLECFREAMAEVAIAGDVR